MFLFMVHSHTAWINHIHIIWWIFGSFPVWEQLSIVLLQIFLYMNFATHRYAFLPRSGIVYVLLYIICVLYNIFSFTGYCWTVYPSSSCLKFLPAIDDVSFFHFIVVGISWYFSVTLVWFHWLLTRLSTFYICLLVFTCPLVKYLFNFPFSYGVDCLFLLTCWSLKNVYSGYKFFVECSVLWECIWWKEALYYHTVYQCSSWLAYFG